jgi:hypothetical protein
LKDTIKTKFKSEQFSILDDEIGYANAYEEILKNLLT